MKRLLVCLTLLMASLSALAEGAMPRDVQKFIDRREGCDHMRGEVPELGDKRRMAELNLEIQKLCKGTDRQLAQLKKKYVSNALVMQRLNEFEEAIEEPNSSVGREEDVAPYRPFAGEYAVYSGSLGDQHAPGKNDRKVSFIIRGRAAQDVFQAMQVDDKETCGSEKGSRGRTKDNVWCTFSPAESYTCYFGFDLRTGKSIPGGIC